MTEQNNQEINTNDDLDLEELAKQYLSNLKGIQWKEQETELQLFFTLSYTRPEIFSILGPLYKKPEMLEFSNFVFEFVTSQVLEEPDIVSKDLLFIASRAVQASPKFYETAVRSLYSGILCHVNEPDFLLSQKTFSEFIDFEPDATYPSFQSVMKEGFGYLGKLLREGPSTYVSQNFLNLLSFWAPFAHRFPNYQIAYCQICMQAIRHDSSLRFNPFRLKILSILLSLDEFLLSISPLAHILEKSFTEKCIPLVQNQQEQNDEEHENEELIENSEENNISQILVGTKEIARTEEYQLFLFNSSLNMLKTCLDGLQNRIAFPEISAPIIMCLQKLLTNQLYEKKFKDIQSFLTLLQKKSSKVQSRRKELVKKVTEDGNEFDITSYMELSD